MPRHRWLTVIEPGNEWTVESRFELQRDDLFIRQANAFLDVVAGESAPACSLGEAAQTLRVNLAILKSVAGRTWIDVD